MRRNVITESCWHACRPAAHLPVPARPTRCPDPAAEHFPYKELLARLVPQAAAAAATEGAQAEIQAVAAQREQLQQKDEQQR